MRILLSLFILGFLFFLVNAMPVLQIKNKLWTVPVQTKITLCHPKGQPPQPKVSASPGKTGWPLGTASSPGDEHQPSENFGDVKKMMWMRKGWAQVPVGTDKPEASSSPAPLQECP